MASGEMCINMEWGNFGALESSRAHLPITPWSTTPRPPPDMPCICSVACAQPV